MYHSKTSRSLTVLFMAVFLWGCSESPTPDVRVDNSIHVEAWADYQADADCVATVEAIRAKADSSQPVYKQYQGLRVIDIHNHGAAGNPLDTIKLQKKFFIDRTILFGNISEPSAVETDQKAYETYSQYPNDVYPFFAGIHLRDEKGLTTVMTNLEKGYLGIGEIVAASTYSPVTSRLPWKAQHPNDGILPKIYQLGAEYGVPVLLHIDPPSGEPIQELEQALIEHPNTIIIFGHANAYNTPANIEELLSKHPNLYIDFLAGFTAYNPESTNKLVDFVPLIEKHPDQFMVSTDSGYGVGQEKALKAIYELLDMLTPETVCKVSHQNMDRLIESQLPTKTQIAQIEALSRQVGEQGVQKLNKRMANELIFELQGKLPEK